MAYNAKAVANYFLQLAKDKGTSLTPMKLQKLVYFAHGWNLALHEEPLIADTIEAWKFGPVVPSLYREFKYFGNGVITAFANELDLEEFDIVEPKIPDDDVQAKALIVRIMETYGSLSAIQLSKMTHLNDAPWYRVRQDSGDVGRSNAPIHEELIRDYFKKQAEQNKKPAVS